MIRDLYQPSPVSEVETVDGNDVCCLVCGANSLHVVLDYGRVALANKFLSPAELALPEKLFPLELSFCTTCTHVQLLHRVAPVEMFSDYLYVSSASSTLRTHFRQLAGLVAERHGLKTGDLVVDVGCNDASLLGEFAERRLRTVGIDPAENLAALSFDPSVERVTGFFSEQTAREIASKWGTAAVVTITNTLPHIQDLRDFTRGVDHLLRPGGALVIETHYLADMLEQRAFDTVYHEHVSYWSLGLINRMFNSMGFEVVRAERLPVHHGQLRATVCRIGEVPRDSSVTELLEQERQQGLRVLATLEDFAAHARRLVGELRDTVRNLRAKGQRVAGYGAPAKATILLSFAGLGSEDLDYIIDRSPLKQGRYTPGSHIPIVDPGRLSEDHVDCLLLFAWNFQDEILAEQAAYRESGGRFLVPVPEVHFL